MTTSVFSPTDYMGTSEANDGPQSDPTVTDKLFTDSRQMTLPRKSPQDAAADTSDVARQGFPQVTVGSESVATDNQSVIPSAAGTNSANDNQSSGALAVVEDLGKGFADEVFDHPGQMLESATIGAVTAVVATCLAPEVLGVACVLGAAYAGFKLGEALPGWIDDAQAVDDPQDHTAAQVAQANTALQGLGAGTAKMGAGFAGFGVGPDIDAAITGADPGTGGLTPSLATGGGGPGDGTDVVTPPSLATGSSGPGNGTDLVTPPELETGGGGPGNGTDLVTPPELETGGGGPGNGTDLVTPPELETGGGGPGDGTDGTTTPVLETGTGGGEVAATDRANMPSAGAEQPEQETLQEGDAKGSSSELRARTPEERAQVVNLLKNAPINDIHMIGDGGAMGKEFYVGKIGTADGQSMDVIVRPIDPSNQIDLSRVSMAQTQANVDQVTGTASGSPETGLRELDLNGKKQLVAVQEYAGKSLGANLREWGAAYGNADESGSVPNEDLTRLLQEHPALKEGVGNNFLQMLYQGNPDLAFLTNGAVRGSQAAGFSLDEPMQIPIIDSKLSFFPGADATDGVANPTFPAPDWGPNGVMGDGVPVIGEYAGRPLSDVSPALQTRAENLQSFFESAAGRQQLQEAGLSENEIDAAAARLQYLTSKGFPPQYGFMDPEFEEISGPLLSKANTYAMQRSQSLSLEKLLQEQERELYPSTETS